MQGQVHTAIEAKYGGVIPPILLQVLFYSLLLYLDGQDVVNYRFGFNWRCLASRSTSYILFMPPQLIFFCYLLRVNFNPKDTADNLKKVRLSLVSVLVKIQQYIEKVLLMLDIRGCNLYWWRLVCS